jgi:2-polyprenyl-3-methyl-5-hydroxy-6-metoxy-1,4-benzoquinol methylase
LLAEDGLRRDRITGVRVNPFTRHFTLQSGTAVNYMLSAVRTG